MSSTCRAGDLMADAPKKIRKFIKVDAEVIQLVERLYAAVKNPDKDSDLAKLRRLVLPKKRGTKITRVRSIKQILETGPRTKTEAKRWIVAQAKRKQLPRTRRFFTPLIVDAKRMMPGLDLDVEYFLRKHS
jgi:hypothetical protein